MSDAAKAILVILAVVLAIFIFLPLTWGGTIMPGWGAGGMMGGTMGWWGPSWGWGGGLSVIPMVIFWLLLVGGVVLLVKWLIDAGRVGQGITRTGESALDILKKRYANGEISKPEFGEMKKDLG